MSDYRLGVEKIAGVAGSDTACGVFTKRVSVENTLGTLVGCVLLQRANDEDLQLKLSDIFEIVGKKIEDTQDGILANLNFSLEAIKKYLSEHNMDASCVFSFFYKDVCYVGRLGSEVKIFVYDPPKSMEITFEAGSGFVKSGQTYVIGTLEFFSIFDTSAFSKSRDVDLGEIIDGLATEISAEKKQEAIGAVFIQVRGEEAEKDKDETAHDVDSDQEQPDRNELPKEQEKVADFGVNVAETGHRPKSFSKLTSFPAEVVGGVFLVFKKVFGGDFRSVVTQRRSVMVIALLALVILGASVGLSVWNKQKKETLQEFNHHLAVASSKYEEGLALVDLNRQRAREILVEAENEAKSAEKIDPKSEAIKKLLSDISAKLKATELSETVAFSEVFSGDERVNSILFWGKNLVAITSNGVDEVNLQTKSVRNLVDVDGVNKGYFYDNNIFYVTGGGIFKKKVGSGQENEEVAEIGEVLDIWVFFGNVYALKADGIAKIVPIVEGWAEPSDYLSSKVEFGTDARFAIDGSIWVTAGDKIYEFLRGQDQNFTISGLVNSTFKFSEIYTSVDLDNLYVVDRVNSALLVIGKDGILKATYQSREFVQASDILVDGLGEKLYVASGDKVLEAILR